MAAPANAGTYLYDSYARTSSNAEDLVDWIANIDPYETPLTISLGRTQAKSAYHQWQIDSLRARNTRGIIEGNDWTAATYVAPTRIVNYCEIFGDDIAVTETEKAENPKGFGDAYAYQLEKATKATMVDIEAAIMASAASATGASGTGRVMKGLEAFITSTVYVSTAYAVNPPSVTNAPATFVAVDVNNMLNDIWSLGGNTDLIVANGAYKRQFSALSGAATGANVRNILATDKKIVAAIDVYDSDFGLIPIQLNRWSPVSTNTVTSTGATATGATDVTGRIWFLQRSLVRLAWLRPLQHNLMGKRGDSTVGQVRAELTLEVGNQKALGVMKGINNFYPGISR